MTEWMMVEWMMAERMMAERMMAEWMMAHPWMTFFLVGLALLVVDQVVANICNAVSQRKDKPLPQPPKEDDK